MRQADFTPAPRARFALVVSLWGVFVSNVTLTILVIALPVIARDLSAPRGFTNWVSVAPLIAVAAATPIAGRAVDRWGARRLWLLGFGLALLGIFTSALAPGLIELVAARFVTGLGSALFMPAALAIITAVYPPHARATPIGYWTSTVAISPLLGVLVGGYLTELLGWRALFFAQLALGLPVLAAGKQLPAPPRAAEAAGTFDWQGAISAALCGGGLLLAFSWLGERTRGREVVLALALAGLSLLWLVRAERRAQAPVFPPALLGQRPVLYAVLARFGMSFTYMGVFMTLPYQLSSLWGLKPAQVALTLSLRPLAMGVVGPFAGRLSRRFGTTQLTLTGAWLILLSSFAFAALGPDRSSFDQLSLALGLVVTGAGLGLGSSGATAAVTERVRVEELGTAAGLMTLTATLANALGMAALFALVELGGGVHSAAAYRLSNLGGGCVAALALACAYALRQSERAHRAVEAETGAAPGPHS